MDLTSGPVATTVAKDGFSLASPGSKRPEAVLSAGFSILATMRSLRGFSMFFSFSVLYCSMEISTVNM